MKVFRRILLATDFSPASAGAALRALKLARASRARLWIVHVLEPVAEAHGVRWAYREMEAELRAGAHKSLRRLQERARKAGVRASCLLVTGAPQKGIVRAARAQRADLVVVGTHGRTGVAGVLLGSVAARVIAAAPCPVLAVRSRGSRR